MAHIEFASSIQRHCPVPPRDYGGATLDEVLGAVFEDFPPLRGYCLTDQGAVRKHIAIFVNDATISDRETLTDAVGDGDKIYVIQALSGG